MVTCVFLLLLTLASSKQLLVPHNRSCNTPTVPLLSYHIHVLFPSSDILKTKEALALQVHFLKEFNLVGQPNCTMTAGDPAATFTEICAFEIDWQPAGPFLTSQYSFFIPLDHLLRTTTWITRNRGSLDILIHPNSGCEVEDHTEWSLWGGTKWELNSNIFSCEYPGCVPNTTR